MKVRLILALGAVLVASVGAAFVAPSAKAIIGGTTDGTTHRSVASLFSTVNFGSCSGSLVKTKAPYDKVVLTAAHCYPNGAHVMVTFDPGPVSQFGSTWYDGVVYDDPAFDLNLIGLGSDDHDVAVVVFTGAIPDLPPYSLAPIGSNTLGASYTAVGYGLTDPYNDSSLGTRMSATFQSSYEDSWYIGSSPTCEGDSGGPALLTIRKKDYVAGITDFGTAGCSTGYEYRVDTAGVQAFINGGFLGTP